MKSDHPKTRLTPINAAEAVFESFWDPATSGLSQWKVRPGTAHGLRVVQYWCWVGFEWARKPVKGPALRMERAFRLDCRQYDRLILSVMPPARSRVTIRIKTDKGERETTWVQKGVLKAEIPLALKGASEIRRVLLEVDAGEAGIGSGWFNWIGLQHTRRLRRYQDEWNRFDAKWEGDLKPEGYQPSWKSAGFLADDVRWERLRNRHDAHVRQHGTSPFLEAAKPFQASDPERLIGEYVNFWNDTRYCRNREFGRQLLHPGPAGALPVAAFLSRDPKLARLAARYAMAIAMCANWDDGMICRFPGSAFDHRAFVQSLCAHEVALTLDLCGEWFTPKARRFLLRRLADEGLSAITYSAWAYAYIHDCNQLAWFSPGRMAAFGVAAPAWPRVRPYVEIACRELVESLEKTVLPDGGYGEGPTYFRCVGRDGGQALYYYARAMGLDFAAILPDAYRRSASFGALVESTVPEHDVIPICDARSRCEDDLLGVMASAVPASRWNAIFQKAIARSGGLPNSFLALTLLDSVKGSFDPPPALVKMPDMGPVASCRTLHGDPVKLLVMGHQAGVGHTHEDGGSFILEFAGDAFAMDPGTCDYSHPLSGLLKNAERHNMLLPEGCLERPHPKSPLPAAIRPEADGDAREFHCTVDAAAGWAGYFNRWRRTLESREPGSLTIRDEYELASGTGVCFCWNTCLPVRLSGRSVVIEGRKGRIEMDVPEGCSASVEALPLLEEPPQQRLMFRKPGRTGSLVVSVRLFVSG